MHEMKSKLRSKFVLELMIVNQGFSFEPFCAFSWPILFPNLCNLRNLWTNFLSQGFLRGAIDRGLAEGKCARRDVAPIIELIFPVRIRRQT